MKGCENLVVDHLSRLDPLVMQSTNDGRINETLLDESLLTIVVDLETYWYAGIVNYLACKVFPPNINYQAKKRLMFEVKKYFWDDPYFFKVCGDNLVRWCVTYDEVLSILYSLLLF